MYICESKQDVSGDVARTTQEKIKEMRYMAIFLTVLLWLVGIMAAGIGIVMIYEGVRWMIEEADVPRAVNFIQIVIIVMGFALLGPGKGMLCIAYRACVHIRGIKMPTVVNHGLSEQDTIAQLRQEKNQHYAFFDLRDWKLLELTSGSPVECTLAGTEYDMLPDELGTIVITHPLLDDAPTSEELTLLERTRRLVVAGRTKIYLIENSSFHTGYRPDAKRIEATYNAAIAKHKWSNFCESFALMFLPVWYPRTKHAYGCEAVASEFNLDLHVQEI